MRLAGPVHGLGGAADIVRTGHAQPLLWAPALLELAFAIGPAALLFDPIDALREPVAVHHEIVFGEGRRIEIVGAAHREGIKTEFARHLVDEAFECKADVDGAVTAEGPARRRVGQHAATDIFDIVQVVDRIEHRARIKNGHDTVTGVRPAALVAIAFDRRDAAVAAHSDLETDVGFGPTAMGDECFLAIDHEAHRAPDPAGE